ncbi:LOW QUALITY PROTEIN: M20/M25/M40 family peptidase, partial [Streptomyces griseoflavus Tu4000]
MSSNPVAVTVASLMPRAKEELTELVAFKSVADFGQFPREESEGAARWIADALTAEGFQDVALLDTPDGTQSVYGFLPGPEGAKTVLLYAHYDVQPPLDEAGWTTPPFELTERGGRWYGRGTADCKGGVILHLLALRALKANGGVPVHVKVIVEGSEEQGTGGLERYAESHPDLLTADTIVIGDAGNFRAGLPTVTSTLRGMTLVRVRVDTLEGNLHSGQFGGAAPDALAALVRVLDSLRAEDGSTTVDGLAGDFFLGRTAVRRRAVPQGRQGARRCGAHRLRHGRRPHLGPPGGHRARHRLPAGGRRHAVRAGERPRAGQPAGAAGRRRGRGDRAAPGAPGGAHAVGRAGEHRADRSGAGVPRGHDQPGLPGHVRRDGGGVPGPGDAVRGPGRFDPPVQHPRRPLPEGGDPAHRPERAGGPDPRGERERVPRRAGAAVGRGGPVPAQLRVRHPL